MAQTSILHHPKLLKSLKTLHDENELEEFLEAFISPFRATLLIVKKYNNNNIIIIIMQDSESIALEMYIYKARVG